RLLRSQRVAGKVVGKPLGLRLTPSRLGRLPASITTGKALSMMAAGTRAGAAVPAEPPARKSRCYFFAAQGFFAAHGFALFAAHGFLAAHGLAFCWATAPVPAARVSAQTTAAPVRTRRTIRAHLPSGELNE